MPLTTIYQLKTFSDLYTAVREELKIQSTDTTAINRIKRDLNIIYLDEVVPFAQWKWLRGNLEATVYASIIAGTASVVQNSNTVTLSVAISASKNGYWFGVVGYNEVYRIAAHTSNSTTLVLEVPYTGTTNTATQYKVWTDEIFLPSFVRETFQITHDFQDQPLESCGLQKFRQYVSALPRAEGRPSFYTTNNYHDPVAYSVPSGLPAISTRASDTLTKTLVFASDVSNYLQQGDRIQISASGDSTYNGQFVVASQSSATITYTGIVSTFESAVADSTMVLKKLQPSSDSRRAKRILIYPAIYNQNTSLHIDYIREVVPMADDTDEPLMPIGDRTILLYGALHRAWSRERNPEEAKRNGELFSNKLTRMAGKMDDSIDQPKLVPSRIYLGAKRMAQRQKDTRNGLPEGWGGGTSGGQVITGTASRVVIFDSTGALAASSVITAELNELSGLLSKAVGISDTQTLTNKTLLDSTTTIANVTDTTKKLKFSLSGSSVSTTVTQTFIASANRTYTYPDISDTLVTLTATQTLTNKTLLDTTTTVANTSDTTKTLLFSLSGNTSGVSVTHTFVATTNRTYTYPDVSDTFAMLSAAQTLTNKTFNAGSNVVSGVTVNMMASTGVSATRVPVSDGSGNVKWQQINSATISSSGATNGQVLVADGSGNSSFSSIAGSLDSSQVIQNASLGYSISSSALVINLQTKSGATPSGGSNVNIPFRNSISSSGNYVVRSVTAATSLTIPNLTTIGTATAQTQYIQVYAIDNAGTVALAVSLSNYWDEGAVQNITAISGGASATTLYASSSFSNLPIRLLGRFANNQTIAGNYVSLPSETSSLPFQIGHQLVIGPSITSDNGINQTTFVTFAPTPNVTITPARTGRFKIYGSFETFNSGSATMGLKITSTGTPTGVAAFIQETFLDSISGARVNMSPYSIFDLLEGTTYNFQLLGKTTAGTMTLESSRASSGTCLICEQIT